MQKLWVIALGATVLGASSPARADNQSIAACQRALGGSTDFTEDKRECYGTLYAKGRYRELADLIGVVAIGSSRQDLYFSGASYLGLATREASDSLKCAYVASAKKNLTRFLEESKSQYEASAFVGGAEDMSYVAAATKMLDAARALKACGDSSYTEDELRRFALRYGRERARNMMFDTSPNDPVASAARVSLSGVSDAMQSLTAQAVKLESRIGMYTTEIQSDLATLQQTSYAIGSLGQAVLAPSGGAAPLPIVTGVGTPSDPFVYDATLLSQLLGGIAAGTSYVDVSAKAIDATRARLVGTIGATGYDTYFQKKKETVRLLTAAKVTLVRATNDWTAMRGSAGWGAVLSASATALPSSLGGAATAVESAWRVGAKALCSTTKPQWYCTAGDP